MSVDRRVSGTCSTSFLPPSASVRRVSSKQLSTHAAGKQKKPTPPGRHRLRPVAPDKIRTIDLEIAKLLVSRVVCDHETATS